MDRRKYSSRGGASSAPPPDAADPAPDIGARLRTLFQAVEAAPVPDDISRLVTELEAKRTGRGRRSH